MMSISDLSQRSLEKLVISLEEVPTLNWRVLMKKSRFATFYSEDVVAIIEGSRRPAKSLLDDLTYREMTLQDLLGELEAIGNKRAASIVIKGARKNGLNMQYSAGRRPPQVHSTGNPQEEVSLDFSHILCREQAESSRTPPVQMQFV